MQVDDPGNGVKLSKSRLRGALKGEAIVRYCEPLITQLEDPAYCREMKASDSPKGRQS